MHAGGNTKIRRQDVFHKKFHVGVPYVLQTSAMPKLITLKGSHRIVDDNDSIFRHSKSIHMRQSKGHFVCFITDLHMH